MANEYKDFSRSIKRLEAKGQQQALKTFKEAAKRVPAYQDFLAKHSINPRKIRSVEDFKQLPCMTKDNYLRQYPMRDLMWDGDEFNGDIISVSSGSTGEPFFWLRDDRQADEAADYFYEMYKGSFQADKIPTLLVVCFSMGIWIAGSYTTLGGIKAAKRGLKMNIITPALDLFDAIAVIKKLEKDYGQVILAGYPPFLKDLIDKGYEEGLNWKNLKIGYTPAGEVIGEELRDFFLKNGTAYKDPTKIISIYGTVDAGIVAHETPLSILLRRQIYKSNFQEKIFGRGVLPTLAQYDPLKRYIEIIDGNVTFTSSTGIPLIRYNIKDSGGVYGLDDLVLNKKQFEADIKRYNVDLSDFEKPFIYIHGRSDFTASLYAVLIYPENIKKALFRDEVSSYVSGRFVMSIKYKKNLDQYLEIVVELKKGAKADKHLLLLVHHAIEQTLDTDNLEYRKLRNSIGKKAVPKVILKENGHTDYFSRTSNKQRWAANALKAR